MPAGKWVQAEATFQRCLPHLRGWAGWYLLIQGDRLVGVFPTRAAARRAWTELVGPSSAAIRQVPTSVPETVDSPGTAAGPDRAGRAVPNARRDPYRVVRRPPDAMALPASLAKPARVGTKAGAATAGGQTQGRTVAIGVECLAALESNREAMTAVRGLLN